MLKSKIDGVVLDVANGDKGNAETYYYYFDLLGSGFNSFAVEQEIQATTVTYEANNGNGWTDVTEFISGGAVTGYTSSGLVTVGIPVPWSAVRIKAVTTNATNALTLSLSRMRI